MDPHDDTHQAITEIEETERNTVVQLQKKMAKYLEGKKTLRETTEGSTFVDVQSAAQ